MFSKRATMSRNKSIIHISLIVLVMTMACMISVGGPDYPEATIPVSTEALTSLQGQIQTAVAAGTATGQITLFVTESQITSILAENLSSQENSFITQPQVYLKDGQVQIFGTAVSGYFKATVSVIMTASIDPEGKLLLELTSANFGPLPVPDGLKEVMTSLVTEAFTGSLGPYATGFQLQSIVIAEGAMMIVGVLK
jgi:hypothetical protein